MFACDDRAPRWASGRYSLVGDAPEHDVVQQRDLLGQLHRRERLEALGLRVLRLQAAPVTKGQRN